MYPFDPDLDNGNFIEERAFYIPFPKRTEPVLELLGNTLFQAEFCYSVDRPRIQWNQEEGVLQLQQAGLSSFIGQGSNVRSREHPDVPFPYLSHGNTAKCEAFIFCYYGKKSIDTFFRSNAYRDLFQAGGEVPFARFSKWIKSDLMCS